MSIETQIVAWHSQDIALTPRLWALMLAKRAELGRVLDDADVLALVEADDGDDRDA